MAENNISYVEAARTLPAVSKSYAEVSASSPLSYHHNTSSVLAQNGHPQISPTISYRKTVFTKPKTRTPLTPGYDRSAHRDLTKNYSFSPSTNGCALNGNASNSNTPGNKLESIILLLTALLNQINIPDHVAHNIVELIITYFNNIPIPTMECQESTTQKT